MNEWVSTGACGGDTSGFEGFQPDRLLWGYGKYFTTTNADNIRELYNRQQQEYLSKAQQQQGYQWQQSSLDPKEEELSLLKEIRSRAQYYAMVILCEQGVAA